MSSALIRQISNLASIGYGVNIYEQSAQGSISGVGTSIVGCVADLPWGPVNAVTSITSTGALFDTFGPLVFGDTLLDTYDALKAFINKGFPNLKIVRTAVSGQVKATETFADASANDAVDVTALYFGALGNSISIAWSANADTAANRDMTVSIGTSYSKKYLNVVVASGNVVTDPGDPYVVIAKNGAYVGVPDAVAATALASGADGTSAAGDYTGSGVGIDKFGGASVDVNILFCGEVPSAQADAVNVKLKSWADTEKKGIAVFSTPAGQSLADAKTYLATTVLRTDRGVYTWPRVKTANSFDPTNAAYDVDPNSFMASNIAQHAPHLSPGGASSREFLGGINSLVIDTATIADYDALNAAGVAPIFIDNVLGALIRKGVTTSITSGETKISRRRMTDFIMNSIAGRAIFYIEDPLDMTLNPDLLGPRTGALVGEIDAFLQGLLVAPGGKQISGYDPTDPFSANTQTNLDADQWFIVNKVKLLGSIDDLVLLATLGETVTLQEAA